jgi:hypothetical protein
MRDFVIIFYIVLALVAFLLVFTIIMIWRKGINRRLAWTTTFLCAAAAGLLVFRTLSDFEFVNERFAFILPGLAVIAFLAACAMVVRSKTAGTGGKVVVILSGVVMLTLYIFMLKLYIDGYFPKSISRQYIGEDFYLYTDERYGSNEDQKYAGKEKMGFIVYRQRLTSNVFWEPGAPDSIHFISLNDSILHFKTFRKGAEYAVAIDLRAGDE